MVNNQGFVYTGFLGGTFIMGEHFNQLESQQSKYSGEGMDSQFVKVLF